MRIKRIRQVTVAVRDLEAARATFERLFDAPGGLQYPVPAFGIRALDMPFGDGTLQLVTPSSSDNPLRRFLERKGEGVYSIAVEVDDLDAAVAELAAKGVRVSEPIEAEPGVRSAFVTMSATHGMSVQLVEAQAGAAGADQWSRPAAAAAPAPREPTPAPSEPASVAGDGDWTDTTARPQALDLTPDEWSDTD